MNLEVCRICGTTKDLKNIFTQGNDELVEQIRLCANIQIDVNDCLPKFVCLECENGLAFSYRLRKRGEETEKKLRQDLLLTTIDEPYSVVDESIVIPESDDNSEMVEEFCDEEIWINDDEEFNKPESLIDIVSKSDEEEDVILHNMAEEPPWVEENNEFLEPEEFPDDDTVLEPVEDSLLEVFEVSQTQDDSNIEPVEVETVSQLPLRNTKTINLHLFEKKPSSKSHKPIKTHNDKKRFHCEICDRWFVHRFRFDEHMKNHSSDGEKAFPCSQCDKSYTNQSNMERHVRSAHKLERKFQCCECGASFGRADILKMHMFMHSDQRTIECEICQKKFKTNQSLHYHMRVHKNKAEKRVKKPKKIKPTKSKSKQQIYLCDQCDKISRHRTTHLNHMRTHTGDKPFKCSTCEKAFRTTSARSNHEILHTDKRPYICKSCGLSFRQISHLSSHMVTHTGEKRHVCNVCQKAFAMRSNLVVHLRIHTGEMPYACSKCPKKFLLSSQFKRHKLIHEDGEEQTESGKNEIEIGGEFHDSQISLYIDDIIERNNEDFEEDIIVSE